MSRLHQTGPSDKDEREQLHQVYQTGQLGVGGGLCRPLTNQESLLLGAMLCVASAVMKRTEVSPSLFITPAVGGWQERGGQLLPFPTPHLVGFQTLERSRFIRPVDGRVKVYWAVGVRSFSGRRLAVLVQDAHGKTDSRPSVEGGARGESYKQLQSAP
ncbi:unnamed protein product [Pleuronectes platessa]|uniref:Uncharacterized protein n=1 Tax=Pleuronectes platessa TaxID=8262 RepID=A0A9N7UY41_PLEPL|nr:unnamed protein product [Pleuronectes platessa]